MVIRGTHWYPLGLKHLSGGALSKGSAQRVLVLASAGPAAPQVPQGEKPDEEERQDRNLFGNDQCCKECQGEGSHGRPQNSNAVLEITENEVSEPRSEQRQKASKKHQTSRPGRAFLTWRREGGCLSPPQVRGHGGKEQEPRQGPTPRFDNKPFEENLHRKVKHDRRQHLRQELSRDETQDEGKRPAPEFAIENDDAGDGQQRPEEIHRETSDFEGWPRREYSDRSCQESPQHHRKAGDDRKRDVVIEYMSQPYDRHGPDNADLDAVG